MPSASPSRATSALRSLSQAAQTLNALAGDILPRLESALALPDIDTVAEDLGIELEKIEELRQTLQQLPESVEKAEPESKPKPPAKKKA